jgi:putative DNA primase/helicase
VDVNLVYKEFINNEKFPRKGAEISDSHDIFDSCGWILNDDEVVVDIDCLQKSVIERIINLFNIKTQVVWTTRGAHLYFRKPQGFKGAKKVCPLGFEVEYKHNKNTQAITVKQNGEMRIIENDGEREELPEIFYTKKVLKPLLGMDKGEGRNNSLFAHRMKIYELKQWQSILRFINNHIFATPLDEGEFQNIIRDVHIDAKKNSEPEVAGILIAKYKIVQYLGKLYWFENNQFVTDDDYFKRMLFTEIGQQKSRYFEELIKQMKIQAPIVDQGRTFDIKLDNGILRDGKFYEVDFKEFTPYCINIPYDPDAPAVPIVDEYIDQLTDNEPEYRNLLCEILAHPLIVNKEFKRMLAKFFIFIGDGANGKGTLLMVIRKILGQQNCSGLSIRQMVDERYFGTLQNKLVNLGDDVEDQAIDHEQMKVIKNISTCDFVASRNLFEMSKEVELTLSLIFTSNHVLKSFEKSHAYQRRVQWCPMFTKPTRKDKRFIEKLTTPDALKYWMKLIVDGYQRLYENEGFTESPKVIEYNQRYHELNNNCIEFLQDFKPTHFQGKRAPESYEEYEIWANEFGLNVHSKKLFQDTMMKVHGLEVKKTTQNGKSVRVYMPTI